MRVRSNTTALRLVGVVVLAMALTGNSLAFGNNPFDPNWQIKRISQLMEEERQRAQNFMKLIFSGFSDDKSQLVLRNGFPPNTKTYSHINISIMGPNGMEKSASFEGVSDASDMMRWIQEVLEQYSGIYREEVMKHFPPGQNPPTPQPPGQQPPAPFGKKDQGQAGSEEAPGKQEFPPKTGGQTQHGFPPNITFGGFGAPQGQGPGGSFTPYISPFQLGGGIHSADEELNSVTGGGQLLNPKFFTNDGLYKEIPPEDHKITFGDVVGNEPAKREFEMILDFMRNPQKYNEIKAKMPRGFLLAGPPGNGKTMMAKALANEARAHFLYRSASSFVAIYVGTGALSVRRLFEAAEKLVKMTNTPVIIFIDEIDALGSRGGKDSSKEYNSTINELLVQLDGLQEKQKIFVFGATNRPEKLDKALLRAGRLEYTITMFNPAFEDRVELLKKSLSKKKVDSSVDVEKVAKEMAGRLAGSNAAEVVQVVEEAARLAARRDHRAILQDDLEDAFAKVVFGVESNAKLTPAVKLSTAYHEVGHALVGYFLGRKIARITCIPVGHALGVTYYSLREGEDLQSLVTDTFSSIASAFGGLVAENTLGTYFSSAHGPTSDLESAQRKATLLATRLLGVGSLDELPEKARMTVHNLTMFLLEIARKIATKIIEENLDLLHLTSWKLYKKMVISGEEFAAMVGKPDEGAIREVRRFLADILREQLAGNVIALREKYRHFPESKLREEIKKEMIALADKIMDLVIEGKEDEVDSLLEKVIVSAKERRNSGKTEENKEDTPGSSEGKSEGDSNEEHK